MAGVQARLRSEHQRKYPELNPSKWYNVAPIFPGVTQRMVNMAGERLARLATSRGFVILRAEHLEFRPATGDLEATGADSEAIA
jgi:hypothetical protein